MLNAPPFGLYSTVLHAHEPRMVMYSRPSCDVLPVKNNYFSPGQVSAVDDTDVWMFPRNSRETVDSCENTDSYGWTNELPDG